MREVWKVFRIGEFCVCERDGKGMREVWKVFRIGKFCGSEKNGKGMREVWKELWASFLRVVKLQY